MFEIVAMVLLVFALGFALGTTWAEKRTDETDCKKGKWVEDDEQIHIELTYHCSECGFQAWGEHEKTDYCGGCGADMRGKE